MGLQEKLKINEILLNLPFNCRLWRTNCGQSWAGKIIKRLGNKIVLENAHAVVGMPTGTSDLIGFTSIEITPDMVGKRVAVFTAYEIKTESYKKVTKEQQNFGDMVQELGGVFKIVD